MKKNFLMVLLTCVLNFAIFPQTGVIRELAGDVQIKPRGASDFSPAQIGSTIALDTIVSTGFRSNALIAIGSTMITVRPLTRLSLAEIQSSAGTETLNVNLQAGRIRVDVTPPAGTRADVSIQSPVATASVRGTSFDMDTRNLKVSSGTVNWSDSNSFSMAVTQGYSSTISDTERVIDPIELAELELTPSTPVGSGDAGESLRSSALDTDGGNLDMGFAW